MSDDLDQLPEEVAERTLSIRLVGLEDVEARYANLLHVNHDLAAFHIILSQFLQPVLTSREDALRLGEQGYVPARVVARVIMTPQMVEQTIDVLQSQLQRYREQAGENGTGAEHD